MKILWILLLLLAGRLPGQSFIDARDHGCQADYRKIDCSIAIDGRVTRLGGAPFTADDIGKILIIDRARVWPEYSLDPVPLNARITAVEAGVAAVENIDGRSRGHLVANPRSTAEFFTDNTDAIARALAAQISAKLSHVQLPAGGVIGLCPMASQTWAANPVYDHHTGTKAVFIMGDGAVLKGHGKKKTRLQLAYFGEFNPIREAPWHSSPVLFMFEPVENRITKGEIASFSVGFPFSPVVQSGYTFIADGWNVSPARHALQIGIRNIATVNPQRNTVSINSSQGGIYDANNALLAESTYTIENCEFETAGGSFKNQNLLKSGQRGGKTVHFTNVTVHGGGNIITRHYLDAASLQKTGGDLFLSVEQKDFTWKNFNAHSDQSEGAFNPNCLVRKAHKAVIHSLAHTTNGVFQITVDAPAPVTKTGLSLLINFGLGDRQIYLEGAASLIAGSPVISARLDHAALNSEQTAALIGAEIRVYYEETLVRAVYAPDSVRRIKLDPAAGQDVTLLGQSGLDVTVNYEGARGAFGHTFYIGHNVGFYVKGLQIHDCAKRSFRVSAGGSEGADGAHELTDYQVHPARGMAAFCNRTTVFTAAEEFGGLLKLRRSKASSVYSVVLDMDEGSTYVAQGGIYGPSIIRNSAVYGSHYGGGRTVIENSKVGLRLARIAPDGNQFANNGVVDESTPHLSLGNCQGELSFQNGVVEAVKSQLQLGFMGEAVQYDQWKTAIRGTYRDCEFTGPVKGLDTFTPEQRADFETRQK
ncbi:MAG: hypothetical protein H7Y36_12485 [Armatimonadetes bacterium]|nr:hypothetical protein [Akkermansiaceae bacterium]